MEETIQKNIDVNPDSLNIGSASKGGAVKIYGDFSDKEGFTKKIDNAKEIRKYAQVELEL